MARPKNTTKPLLPDLPTRVGRPAAPKLAIGFLGPELDQSTTGQVEQAHAIGQAVAKLEQTLFALSQEGCAQAAAKGAKDQSGLTIGFSQAGTIDQHQRVFKLPVAGFDHLIFTNSTTPKRLERFLSSLDALIIIALPQAKQLYGSQLPPDIPLGILTSPNTPTTYIQPILDLTKPSNNPVLYNQNPRELVKDIIRLTKQLKRL